MMTNSFQQNNRDRRRLLIATGIVVVVLLFDLVSGGGIRTLVRSVANALWQGSAYVVRSIDSQGYFASKTALAHENAGLRAEVARLRDVTAGYAALQEQYSQLQALAHFVNNDSHGVTAVISSPSGAAFNDTYVVSAGSQQGVSMGDVVITDSGVVVGLVKDVSANTSLVMNVFSSGVTVDAVISKNAVTLTGRSGNGLGRLARNANVIVNDPVFAPSLANRPIGVVQSVQASSSSGFRDVYVGLPVNPTVLQFVYIVPKNKK